VAISGASSATILQNTHQKKRASNQNALYRLTNYKQQLITDAALDGAKEEEEEEEEEFNNKYNKTRSWKSVSVVGFFLV
jgi:hypothetical protein